MNNFNGEYVTIPKHVCPSDWLLRSVEDEEENRTSKVDAEDNEKSRRGRKNVFDPLCTLCWSAKRENSNYIPRISTNEYHSLVSLYTQEYEYHLCITHEYR